VLAAVLAAPPLFVGLGRAPFDDPGEGQHAEIARELLHARDPFALTLDGVAYVDKPPLLYALMAGVFAVAGASEGTARAVPALAALAAVAGTAWLGARLLGARAGFVAGAALLTSAGFFAFGRYVRPETLFAAALAWGFALVLTGLADARRGRVVAGLVAFAVAVLAKDPLGAVGPLVALGAGLALAGRAWPLGRWLPWPGVLLAVLLGFGWWALAEWRTPGFVWYTVVDNHVLNVVGARRLPDEDVPLSALEFLAVAVMGAAPWVLAAGAAIWGLVRRRAWRDESELPWTVLALWIVVIFGGTALSAFRLPHYGVPAYFAIALLAARGWQEHGGRGLAWAHAVLFAALALACGLLATSEGARFMQAILGATDVAARKSAVAGEAAPLPPFTAFRPLCVVTALAFGVGALALAGFAVVSAGRYVRRAAPFIVVVTMFLVLPSVAAGLSLVASHRAVRGIALELARLAGPDDVVVHEGPIENSGALEWYSGRRPVIVDGRRSVLAFGALGPEARDRFWDGEQLRDAWLGGRRVWVVSVRAPERSAVARLPGARLVTASGGRWLWTNGARALARVGGVEHVGNRRQLVARGR
jgi:hypothetical protein